MATDRRSVPQSSRRALLEAAETQRRLCRNGGSPTYVALIDELSSQLIRGVGPGQDILMSFDGDPTRSALILRLLAAVNRVVQEDPRAELRRWYPTLGGAVCPARAVEAFRRELEAHGDQIRANTSHSVQTNEVGRSAPLSAAMHYVARVTGLPFQLRELGASAGVNLFFDRYCVECADTGWGDPASQVRLTGNFETGSPPPPPALLEIADRAGCDLSPLDASCPDTLRLLSSFIWPEQTLRLKLLRGALSLTDSGVVERADVIEWLTRALASHRSGHTMVIFHSVVTTYFTDEQLAAMSSIMEPALDSATAGRPVAWISLEPDEEFTGLELSVAIGPYHERKVLATCTPHGRRVRWLGPR